jgi:ribosomal protein S18 acetylase RimI-like enzyme
VSVAISPVQPEEASVVCERFIDLSAEGLGFPEQALGYFRDSLTVDSIAQQAQNPKQVLLAARRKGELVGLLLGTPPEGGVATIVWVLVAPECRREGIGCQMFQEACRRYRDLGCHKVKLTVPNEQTVQFYEKQGMQVEGFHANHWWHVDFWSLGKSL